ncbi:MAG: GNAT family N-acetyltransferase [Sarcina sp.]
MEIVIENLKLEDFEEFNELFLELHMLHAKNRGDIYLEVSNLETRKIFEEELNDEKAITLCARCNSKIVGVCLLTIKETGDNKLTRKRCIGYMEVLIVKEEFKKQGIGKKLFDEVKRQAVEMGAEYLELMSWEFNEPALKFYEKQGMKTRSRTLEMGLSSK